MTEPFTHWVVYGIPPEKDSIPEGDTSEFKEGTNSWGETGYGGPMPPEGHGEHHYHFKLYALDQPVDLPPGASKHDLLSKIEDHILDEATLQGVYERPRA